MSERKIVDYVVLTASKNYVLREKVLDSISKGFVIYGFPLVCAGDNCDNREYCQAMVKYED